DGTRRIDGGQRVEENPGRRLAIHSHRRFRVVTAHEMVRAVNGEDGVDATAGYRVAHRQGRQGRMARGVVNGLETEDRAEARGTRSLDAPAEGADLVPDHLQGRRPLTRRWRPKPHPQEGQAAVAPLRGGPRRHPWDGRGTQSRPGGHAPVPMSKAVLVHAG